MECFGPCCIDISAVAQQEFHRVCVTVHRSHHKGCLAALPSCIDVNAFVQQAFDLLFQPATMASCYQLLILVVGFGQKRQHKDQQYGRHYHHKTQNAGELYRHEACLLV